MWLQTHLQSSFQSHPIYLPWFSRDCSSCWYVNMFLILCFLHTSLITSIFYNQTIRTSYKISFEFIFPQLAPSQTKLMPSLWLCFFNSQTPPFSWTTIILFSISFSPISCQFSGANDVVIFATSASSKTSAKMREKGKEIVNRVKWQSKVLVIK